MENNSNRARIAPENIVYQKPRLITDNTMHYCPGCSHGTLHKLVAEVIDEMGLEEKTIAVSPVGCSVLAYDYIDVDWVEAAHGRAPAVATALSRLHPEHLVFTYQGDGDLTAIGMGEFMHACNRGDNITVIYVNNGIYGMTGGQMAPTTLLGAKTVTSPEGRRPELHGYPCKIADMIKILPGVTYVTRQSVNNAASVKKTKKALRHAFENSLNHKGLSFVEVVSTCSSGWKLTPTKANEWLAENMFPFYELGDLKNE